MRIEEEVKLDFDDVLIRPKRSEKASRKDVVLERTYTFKHSKKEWTGIPLIACNMDTVGTIEVARKFQEVKLFTWLHKFYRLEDILGKVDLDYCCPTVGEHYYEITIPRGEFPTYLSQFPFIHIDVANGYREDFVDYVSLARKNYPRSAIFAGNVATPEMVQALLIAGADIVVVGLGSGGQCTTRVKTGVGYPQLSAISECADAAHGLRGHIVADGGCRTPGDVCKAFAAGADFVALGSMLAAHDENTDFRNIYRDVPVGTLLIDEHRIPAYTYTYGMSSEEAMKKHYGGVAEYRTSEGKKTRLYMRGPIMNTMQDVLGGLRSCCTYVGASSLKELSKCTTFVKVNNTHNTFWKDE